MNALINITNRLNIRRGNRSDPLRFVPEIRSSTDKLHSLDSKAFHDALDSFKSEYRTPSGSSPAGSRSDLHALLMRAIAFANEGVYRTHGFYMHDVQLAAVLATANGAVAEMQTGEGKTIVTGATAFVKSLGVPHVHVATTNQYLASRDCESLQDFFQLLQTRCVSLPEKGELEEMRPAYDAEITYGPGYQFGFDFLRDQVTLRKAAPNALGQTVINQINGIRLKDQLIQRSRHFAMIVDEADSVMIDEAMTPMILSGPSDKQIDRRILNIANRLACDLVEYQDYTVDHKNRRVELKEEAKQGLFDALLHVRQFVFDRPWSEYVQNALQANVILQRDEDYVVQDDAVMIVDQMTGRIFADRSWKNGLHQAVEAKEGVTIKPGNDSIARVTRQRYFHYYQELCGLTGTAQQVTRELAEVYGCPVVEIPTHKPSLRKEFPARYFATVDAKMKAVASASRDRNERGQPILIGTRTIQESLLAEQALQQLNLKSVVLNGKQDMDEAEIVSAAGQEGAITIATNMAGRGTDIKLNKKVTSLGGLHVIATEHNHSRRVDRQLIGRCARQGKPGSYQFFISAEDELIYANAPQLAKSIESKADPSGECHHDFGDAIQQLQERLETEGYESRRQMVRHDCWMDKVRESLESFGG